VDRIEKIKIDFPIESLNLLIEYLIRRTPWEFALDYNNKSVDSWIKKLISGQEGDKGFSYCSFDKYRKISSNDVINTYALIIFDAIKQKSQIIKSNKITRFFWNYYNPLSKSIFHTDNENFENISIIFNLHSNSGGSEFKINEKTQFIQSVQNEAIVFPSTILHRGIAPKKEPCRFSLNIIVEGNNAN